MGNSAFYYYPEPNAFLERIDLGLKVTSVLDWEVRDEEVTQAMSGALSRIVYRTQNRLRVRIELFGSFSVITQLETFLNYMKAGGYCSFTEDRDAVAAGYVTTLPRRGVSSLRVERNLFDAWEPTYNPSAGEFIVVQGPSPRMLREVTELSSTATNTFNLASTLVRDFSKERWTLVRDRRFHPFLRLDPSMSSIPNLTPGQGRVTWTIELELFEPPDMLDRYAFAPRGLPDLTEEATDFDFESQIRGPQAELDYGQISAPYGDRGPAGGLF